MATTQSANQSQAQQSSTEWWNPLSWFSGLGNAASNWLGGIGGGIASGLEGGFVAFFKDMWAVILPFIEIAIGALVIMWAVGIYFAKEGIQLASFVAKAAA